MLSGVITLKITIIIMITDDLASVIPKELSVFICHSMVFLACSHINLTLFVVRLKHCDHLQPCFWMVYR